MPAVGLTLSSIVLAGFNEASVQICLAPVYGSLPARSQRLELLVITALFSVVAVKLKGQVRRFATRTVPLFVIAAPYTLYYLGRLSSTTGPLYGSAVAHILTCTPLTVLASCLVSDHVFAARQTSPITLFSWRLITTSLIAPIIVSIAYLISNALLSHAGRYFPTTRIWLFIPTATLYAIQILRPRHAFMALALSAWVLSLSLNSSLLPPFTTSAIDHALHELDFSLIDRSNSVTGYVSVVEATKLGLRVLRCDHSLLGGHWLPTEEGRKAGFAEPESMYSIFTMLEAVRLVQADEPSETDIADRKDALVIGLGIGSSPSALAAHGVNVTAIELDPAVILFAKKYFGLHAEVDVVESDATLYVRSAVQRRETYDYLIHDVFTGGLEPEQLFRKPFLQGLHSLMKPSGVIAINYGGDLNSQATAAVLDRIVETFARCELFRDQPPPAAEAQGPDFVNVVAFCTIDSEKQWRFRAPVEPDFLGSPERAQYLLPKFRVEWPPTGLAAQMSEPRSQLESAVEHWRVMRAVLPAAVWELW